MLFSRRSATSACAIVLIVMAVTPYHRFSSSIGLVSGAMTWLVILGACLAAFGLLCSRRFYSIRVCAYLAVARRFMRLVLCWVVAPLICNLGYGGLSFDAGGDAG